VNGWNWLLKLIVFSFLSTVAVSSGWASLLDIGSPRSSVAIGCPKFCELKHSCSPCLSHWSKFIWESPGKNQSGDCNVPSAPDPEEPRGPLENRYLIDHHPGTGMTGRSNGGNGTNASAGSGVLSGNVVCVAATPTSDWLMSHVQLIWRSPPIWELLKVPIL